jgi:hypothetical protein
MDLYGITQENASMDYQRYRDSVGDYQNNRATNYGEYSDSRNFDYGKFGDDRAYKDALAAKAAARSGGGGGRGRAGNDYSDSQLDGAIGAFLDGGDGALNNYINGLIASGMSASDAYALRRAVMSSVDNKTPDPQINIEPPNLTADQLGTLNVYETLNPTPPWKWL